MNKAEFIDAVASSADLSKADLGWDCGACGFKTCGELIKHFRKKGGQGRVGAGAGARHVGRRSADDRQQALVGQERERTDCHPETGGDPRS